jgi:2-polyprenyl-3-methyl-5-hydroxy-6-metoxy-1,4-benzoquinol methylase
MDDPGLDCAAHTEALNGIARLNRLSGAEMFIWREIRRLRKVTNQKRFRLLDIATGGGDVPIALLDHAAHSDFELEIDACDKSEQGLEDARTRASKAGASVNFFQFDALSDEFPTGYDIVTTSLFTHHLEPSQVVRLMEGMKSASNSLVLIDDLERSFLNLILVSLATYTITRSPVARHDGPASVKGSYTRKEMLELSKAAGLKGAQIYLHFPCRFLLSWSSMR